MMKQLLATVMMSLFLVACSAPVRLPTAARKVESQTHLVLYQHQLNIRLSRPVGHFGRPVLILYSTGDGGWRGLDNALFEQISAWGYPVAGFSSKNYLEDLSYFSDTTTPRRLSRDFDQIIQTAENSLELPSDTPVILVGLSRGAGLSVVAAGQGEFTPRLAGVVAIALTPEEEHVVSRPGRHRKAARSQRVDIRTYEYLRGLVTMPIAVIQSTNDKYLPAAEARKLFGTDTQTRQLIPIEASNHSFRSGLEELSAAMHSTLDRMVAAAGRTGNPAH
jgi:hypothetical protein